MERCSVSIARQRLIAAGLKKMEGANNTSFEIWLWPNSKPEMISYADGRREEFLKSDVDDVLSGTSY